MRLKGKIAGVTGAGQGIGRAIALRLAEEGADLVVSDINKDTLSNLDKEIKDRDCRCYYDKVDVTKSTEVDAFIDNAVSRFGQIDIWVNNAGIIGTMPLLDLSEEAWDQMLAVNLKGCLICSQIIGKKMKTRNSGRIINMSSAGGKIGSTLTAHYCASKAGVISLTKSMALVLAANNITVNAVCPGVIKTAMWEKLDQGITQNLNLEKGQALLNRVSDTPQKRAGTPECVAALVAFLASDESWFITGQSINIDGGLVMH